MRTTQEILFGPITQAAQTERWFFTNRENTRSGILGCDFVVLAASAYDRFEEFTASLETALEIVRATCAPDFSNRVGLRYVDLIRVAQGQSLGTYLQPGIRGIQPEELGARSLLHQVQLRAETPAGVLAVRLWQNRDGRVLPPDIAPEELPFKFESPAADEILTILDIDHYSVDQRNFDPSALIRHLWSLHDGTDRAFRSIVTPEAMRLWGETSPLRG
jgi:uncharacterized protein (TIGR04255 family)